MQKKLNTASASIVEELHSLSNKPGNPSRKKELLLSAMSEPLKATALVSKYHDTLLFLLAYPENAELLLLAKIALEKLCIDLNVQYNDKLEGTGIISTTLITCPTFELLKRLNELFPEQIRLDSSNADKETVSKIFKLLLPIAEHETIDKKDLSLLQRIRQVRKGNASGEVAWLLNLFADRFGKDEFLLDYFFNALQLYISIPLNENTFSRTTLRSLPYPTYFHKTELKKHVDVKKILDEKISPPLSLKLEERIQLADASRAALALLLRETDPVTYANPNEIEWHDMGKGFRIALFGMVPSRRFSFDSYIGYMAFKNGIPAAYGGAWMMGEGAKVGVNIFEPLRGGESAWTFCQILRLYRQRYNVEKFVVEPYQYGKHNPEGIKSGAFWFYYRLGFRPVNEELRLLAEAEAKTIRDQKGYRTSAETLQKFTHSNIELRFTESAPLFPDTEKLSAALTEHIATHFSGDRKIAEASIQKRLVKILGLNLRKWSVDEQEGFRKMSLLLLLVSGIESWNKAEKAQLAKLLKARGGAREFEYIQLLRKHVKLLKALTF